MRTVQMEYLRPDEIAAERERFSVAYLPVAPLEWHGPAMPFGTDPLLAQEWARAAARITGGVVAPTVFFGTERERPASILKAKGFADAENLYIKGMDVPKNNLKSFYAREEIFSLMVREYLRLLVQTGYRLIVIVNGHGAWGQRATLVETSLIRYLYDEHVDLKALPPKEVKLKYTDWGMADDFVFSGTPSKDDCVVFDPRDATPQLGEKFFKNGLASLCAQVQKAYEQLE